MRCLFAVRFLTIVALGALALETPIPAQEGVSRDQVIRLIDRRVAHKAGERNLSLNDACTDAEFIRRVHLDLTGVVPRPTRVQQFLGDDSPEKRRQLIDELLDSPSYATHMANNWRSHMLPGTLGPEEIANVLGVQNWLRRQFAANARYDRLVADLIVATGGGEQGPALFYTVNELKPEKIAGATARIFLGLQLECAQCHDHPFDRWTQRDFWGYAAFFGQLDRAEGRFRAVRLTDDVKREVTLPDSEEVIAPKYPGGEKASVGAGGSRRVQLAIWMSNRENPYLAKAAVNLLWAQMFGRGLVNPIDDIGPHNAPSHPEVFDALADYFVQSGYDVKELLRTIASTETYQRSSRGKLLNVESESWYARRSVKPLSADQFFASLQRLQDRSIEQPSRIAQFLQPEKQAFLAKLRRQSRDPIEFDAGVPQALTLMNGRQIQRATDPQQSGVIGALQAPWLSDQQRIELVFLSTVSRLPTAEESDICIKMVRKGKSQDVLGDILWSLINSAEFAFNY